MLRRPPGEGRLVAEHSRTKVLLALAVLVLAWFPLADAQQQQRQQQSIQRHQPQFANILHGNVPPDEQRPLLRRHLKRDEEEGPYEAGSSNNGLPVRRHESPFEADRIANQLPATISSISVRPESTQHGHDGHRGAAVTTAGGNPSSDFLQHDLHNSHDASALATVAPDSPVRAPKSLRQLSSILADAGLSSPQSARSLERWEVEDFVLLATVDGHLYAVSRDDGVERWHLQVDQPTVETIHHRRNHSTVGDPDRHPLDDYIWAVEPTADGPIYVWMPTEHGAGLASTGFTMRDLVDHLGPWAVEHPPVVYTGDKKTTMVSLDAATGRVIKYFGQGASKIDPQGATCPFPNDFDTDSEEECSNSGIVTLSRIEYTVNIHRQDNGDPIATLRYSEWGPNNFDHDLHRQYHDAPNIRYLGSRYDGKLYTIDKSDRASSGLEFSVPVARVFELARPDDVPKNSNPELVLLPQPIPPPRDSASWRDRSSSVFLNHTESGSWVAMSAMSYPLILDAPSAPINTREGMRLVDSAGLGDSIFTEALVGNHRVRSIPEDVRFRDEYTPLLSLPPGSNFGSQDLEPQLEDNSSSTLASRTRPTTWLGYIGYAADSLVDLITNPFSFILFLAFIIWYLVRIVNHHNAMVTPAVNKVEPINETPQPVVPLDTEAAVVPKIEPSSVAETVETDHAQEKASIERPAVDGPVSEKSAVEPVKELDAQVVPQVPVVEVQVPDGEAAEKPKKKNHRGTRGGVKHRKKKQGQAQSSQDKPPSDGETIQEQIKKIIPEETTPQPDVRTIASDPDDIGAGAFEINGLRVNMDEQLGMGSNGTVVYSGTFHGREVAVKRMLSVFYDVAYQETKLLLESDNHPNVIQYFAFHQTNAFLYIALERCQASLADVVEKPDMYRDLARAGNIDIPNVLLQIANGLSHLHSLRIVHRDLKPQNILVTMTSEGKPRLVVSDFGLCKKLDGAQSSFGATTAHAAGTSGWRAPELLLDDDARENSGSMASTHSESSQLVSADLMPNRRATRAIDIFSLGLVFFYVLTKGSHPFDCGDRYMREVNIRKGQMNLNPLEVLGDFAYEAENLIRMMLEADPHKRPSVKQIMAHPFFWGSKKRLMFLCDVSDHFEKEQRDPPSDALSLLESYAPMVCRGDFLKQLTPAFVESLGKQRKYTGTRMLDLLRALRNKWNHREDMTEALKKSVGISYEEYLGYWTIRFPNLLVICCEVVLRLELQDAVRFQEYFEPMRP